MSDIYGLKDSVGCYYSKQFPNGAGKKYYSDQRDDPTENLYRVLINQIRLKYPQVHWGWLESCGVNAMTNCFGATLQGRRIIDKVVQTMGTYESQFPHILTGYLNDPNNWPEMQKIRNNLDPSKIQGNRVPQYYVLVALRVCGIIAHFEWGCDIEKIKEYLKLGHPVQVCEPGHYLAVISYNKNDTLNVYNSYPRNNGSGINEIRTKAEIDTWEDWHIWYEIQ